MKKSAASRTITAMSPIFIQPARVRDPMVQNLIDMMPSELPATAMMKLEKAVSSAFTIMPARISFTEVVLPSAEARASTRKQARPAPRNAQKPDTMPTPRNREPVAPSVAPAETPSI